MHLPAAAAASEAGMRIDIVTIFPEYFAPLEVSLIGKAAQRGEIAFGVHDLRSWAHDPHRTVDDTPFGGGPGMVMRPEPWGDALDALLGLADPRAASPDRGSSAGGAETPAGAAPPGGVQLIVPTPSGEIFSQGIAAELAQAGHLIFACGRYEGIDAR